MAPLIDECEASRRRSTKTRLASASLRAHTRATRARTSGILLHAHELRERLVVHSAWSDLPWRLPPRDFAHVLVSVLGGLDAADET